MDRGRMSRASSSKRMSEQPMRVTDSNRTSMYTTPQSKKPSLYLNKPQSVNSERKTSFFGGRSSGMGLPRNSIVGGFGGVEKIKDVRPLHDKAFVQQCIRQLSEFLSEKGYLGTVSTKTLQSPSTKEFLKIFEFIYSQLDPAFQMPTSKVEEELPRILKDQGYPFPLSKSSMYSVGAPHTWPQVLGALVWLIDDLKVYSCMSVQEQLLSEFSEDDINIEEEVQNDKLFLDYTFETYVMFIQEADTFEEEDEAYLAKLKKLYNVNDGLLASMEEKNRLLSDEVEQLEKENHTDRLMTKRKEKVKLQADLQNIQGYRSSLESYKANLESKDSKLNGELEATGQHLESLKQEQDRLQHVLQNQKFTPADVERLNGEKRELQQTTSSLTQRLEEAKQLVWTEEIALDKVKEKANLKLVEYHKLARKLKLIPASAENACGHDFEIKSTAGFAPSSMVQYKTQIQMPLMKLIVNVEEENSRQVQKKLVLDESIEQVNSNILHKSNDLKRMREQICRLDEWLTHDDQEEELEEQRWAEEVVSMENNQKLLEKKVNQGYDEAMQQLKAAQQQFHLVLQETNEERRLVNNNLTSIFTSTANHLVFIENFMEEVGSKVHRVCSKATEGDEAAVQKLREMIKTFISKANRT